MRMQFATKPIQHYPSHLRHVATLPWEMKNSIFGRYSADMKENGQYFDKKLYLMGYTAKKVDSETS